MTKIKATALAVALLVTLWLPCLYFGLVYEAPLSPTQEKLKQVRIGMTRSEALEILGDEFESPWMPLGFGWKFRPLDLAFLHSVLDFPDGRVILAVDNNGIKDIRFVPPNPFWDNLPIPFIERHYGLEISLTRKADFEIGFRRTLLRVPD